MSVSQRARTEPGRARGRHGESPAGGGRVDGPRGPRWLVGDWGRIIRDPADILRLAFLVGIPVVLVIGPREEALRLLLTLLVCLIAHLIATPAPFDFGFCAAMSLQAWGNIGGAFDAWLPYHRIVHFCLTLATAALFYFVLVRLRLVPDLSEERSIHQRLGIALLTFAIGTMVGAVYEEYEWFAIHYLGAGIVEYYQHDIDDLFYNGLGSLGAGLLLVLWVSRGWGTRRRAGGDPLRGLLERLERRMERSATDESRERSRAGRRRRRVAHLDRGEHDAPQPHLPRILAGDWTRVVRDPIDLLRLSFFAGVWVSVATGDWQNAVRFGLTFLAVVAARALSLPRLFDLAFGVAMAFQAWGSYAGALRSIDGYEMWTHFAVSLGFSLLLYLALVRAKVFPDFADEPGVHRRVAVFLSAMCLGYGVGVYYELYIWLANHALGAHYPVSWDRLTRSLALDWLGSGVGAACVVLWDVYGWGTRRRLPAAALASS